MECMTEADPVSLCLISNIKIRKLIDLKCAAIIHYQAKPHDKHYRTCL